jgi:SSS family solute:Na+ symporter
MNVVAGIPRWAGTLVAATVVTIYFVAGGLLGSAKVNSVQLFVMLAGFLVALPMAVESAGGLSMLASSPATPPWFGDFFYSTGPLSGWTFLVLTGPSFIISPGLIQKAYGAESERAVRLGIVWNAIALMLFAFIPVLFGMAARTAVPGIEEPNLVLPTFLATQLPVWLGGLALAALFSTEVDTCDAILFMLSTAMSNDLYKRHINPAATDAQLLRVARVSAIVGGALGVALSLYLGTVTDALTIFYSVIIVSMLVPVIGGLYLSRPDAAAALASIAFGLSAFLIVRLWLRARYAWMDPVLSGIAAAAVAYGGVALFSKPSPPPVACSEPAASSEPVATSEPVASAFRRKNRGTASEDR